MQIEPNRSNSRALIIRTRFGGIPYIMVSVIVIIQAFVCPSGSNIADKMPKVKAHMPCFGDGEWLGQCVPHFLSE